jgi:hypothetical protein
MFKLSVKDLAGDMTYLTTSSLKDAKIELAIKYGKDLGCIVLFDLSTGKELADGEIVHDTEIECGVYISSYSKEDKEVFEKFTYPYGGNTIFFFDVYMDVTYDPKSIEKELFVIIHKLPELFEWIHDRHVTQFTFETYHIAHEWFREVQTFETIFDTLVQCLSNNSTLKHLNLGIFQKYLSSRPEQLEKLQDTLNGHPLLSEIYLSRHDQRNDKVVKLVKGYSNSNTHSLHSLHSSNSSNSLSRGLGI